MLRGVHMKTTKTLLGVTVAVLSAGVFSTGAHANSFTEAFKSGKAYGNLNLRFEGVDQDGFDDNASALTLRTRLGFTTGEFATGWTMTGEFEDSRSLFSVDEYSVPQTGFNPGEYPVVADPQTTELDQAFVQYKNDTVTVKAGRQVFTLDGHRFIGHVGWRQDRQTFDAISAKFTLTEAFTVTAAYLDQRNRIFAEAADIDSNDIILHGAYKLGDIGTLKGYAYLLENEADDLTNDTFGVSFSGGDSITYHAEFATQEAETTAEIETDYLNLEIGGKVGAVKLKAGYEVLGSDDGAGGFQTPLATLHKFNGWADVFLNTPSVGLEDISIAVSGKAGDGSWSAIYHKFDSNEASIDLGSEIDLIYKKKYGAFTSAVKAAFYTEGDEGTAADRTKLWVWTSMAF